MGDAGRSYEGLRAGQQLYARIEFCNDPEALWGKIASGHWDWLGVWIGRDGRRRFVVGAPRVGRMTAHVAGVAIVEGASDQYIVASNSPEGDSSRHVFRTEEEARLDYAAKIDRLTTEDGSLGLYRIRLVIDGRTVDERLIVKARPNVL